jgi:hypothetical protein
LNAQYYKNRCEKGVTVWQGKSILKYIICHTNESVIITGDLKLANFELSNYHDQDMEVVLKSLGTSSVGITEQEAAIRLDTHGLNEIIE